MKTDVIEMGMQLATLFDFTTAQAIEATTLYEHIALHPQWNNKRSNHALMVDCIYETGKKYECDITINKVIDATKERFGISTQPKPHIWRENFVVQ